jgi:intracellular septation protein A
MTHLLAAFLSGVAVDVLATLVFHYTNKNKAVMAASVNVVLTACVLYIFVDVSKDPMQAIPYLIGIWVGGILGIALKKHLEKP